MVRSGEQRAVAWPGVLVPAALVPGVQVPAALVPGVLVPAAPVGRADPQS